MQRSVWFVWLWIAGSGAKAQHYPADVWRKGWRGGGAETGPWRCEEHVQNPDWWTAKEPEVNQLLLVPPLGLSQTNQLTISATHAFTGKEYVENLVKLLCQKETLIFLYFILIHYYILYLSGDVGITYNIQYILTESAWRRATGCDVGVHIEWNLLLV